MANKKRISSKKEHENGNLDSYTYNQISKMGGFHSIAYAADARAEFELCGLLERSSDKSETARDYGVKPFKWNLPGVGLADMGLGLTFDWTKCKNLHIPRPYLERLSDIKKPLVIFKQDEGNAIFRENPIGKRFRGLEQEILVKPAFGGKSQFELLLYDEAWRKKALEYSQELLKVVEQQARERIGKGDYDKSLGRLILNLINKYKTEMNG